MFFTLGLITLPHYGVNWDAASHLQRGQAYLHYYLTGEKDYTNLDTWSLFWKKYEFIREKTALDSVPRYRLYFQREDTIFFDPDVPKEEVPRVSMHQLNENLGNITARYDYGHPHISDVLSSVFNFVLYQKLGLINDIDAYRIYGIFLAACLVGLTFWWTAKIYGKFAGIVAALSLSVYPLFWAESHFNTEKDLPETVFWSFVLFSVFRGITRNNWRWILVSGVFFGLALGTKFNVLFSFFVLLPWLAAYLIPKYKKGFSVKEFLKSQRNLLLALITMPFLGVFLYLGTWPFFLEDPVGKINQVISFYKTIGTDANVDPRFLGPLGINTYASLWILYTTPLVILFLAGIGMVAVLKRIKDEKDKVSLLFLLWLVVPIIRVTWPGTNIYGGVRQIMEYIPAMAIIAGIGASQIVTWLSNRLVWVKQHNNITIKQLQFVVLLLFIPIIFKLIEIHPNENVYFNPLIGGLKGAKEQDFPGWGVSFGAPYRKAIEWVNKNAEPGSRLTLGYEILSNIPGIFIRPDIDYNRNNSGYLRRGEYVISLRFNGTERRSYLDMYLDRMVEPVYQIAVDNVPILKVWKNDKEHLLAEWKNEDVLDNLNFVKKDDGLLFDIGRQERLSRLELEYEDKNCPELAWGYIMLSKDGEAWERVPGVLPEEVRVKALGIQPGNGKFIEPFAGQEARFIDLILSPPGTCLAQVKNVELYYFK